MANKKSAARQAIKDMLAENLDITMFIGKVNRYHALNELIGIDNEPIPVVKVEVKVEVEIPIHNYMPPEVFKAPKRTRYVFINGVQCLFDEYDND